MTLVLCAKKNKSGENSGGTFCFSSKSKKIENIRMKIEVFEKQMHLHWISQAKENPNQNFSDKIPEISRKKYRIISEIKLQSGFTVPTDTIVLGWEGHTFGLIDGFSETPIRIPTFNYKKEFVYDTFASVPAEKLSCV